MNKLNSSTIMGYIIFIATIVVVFLDMFLSTKINYGFVLEAIYIWTGLGIGIGLVVLPQETIVDIIKKKFSK